MDRGMDECVMKFSKTLAVNIRDGYSNVTLYNSFNSPFKIFL